MKALARSATTENIETQSTHVSALYQIARQIKRTRLMQGRKLEEIAESLRICIHTMQQYEEGTLDIPAAHFYQLSIIYGVNPQHFVEGIIDY